MRKRGRRRPDSTLGCGWTKYGEHQSDRVTGLQPEVGGNVFGKTRINFSCLSLFAIVIQLINYSTGYSLNYSTLGDLRISRVQLPPHILHEMSHLAQTAMMGPLPMNGRKVLVGHNFYDQQHVHI